MKKTIAILTFALLLTCALFLVAQAPPGPSMPEASVEDASHLEAAAAASPGFPQTIQVTPATNAAPAPAPNPMFQGNPRGRTNASPSRASVTNRPPIPVRPLPTATPQGRPANAPLPGPAAPAGGTPPGVAPPPAAAPATAPNMKFPQLPTLAAEEPRAAGANTEVPGVILRFLNTPIENILDFYADLTRKMVIRSPQVPATTTITVKSQVPLTESDAKQALDTALALNGLSTVPVGDKMITVVPMAQALQEGAAFGTNDPSGLPEAATFITQVVKLTNAIPSEVMQTLSSFSKVQGGVVAIDSSGVLVLRDYAVNVKRMLEIIERVEKVTESPYKLEVIPIKFGKVADIYDVMSGLIGGGSGGTGGSSASRTSARRTSSRGSSRLGANTANRTTMPGQQPTATPAPTASANTFQRNLQSIVARAASGDSQILGDAKVIPDERANSLVVYADKRDMEVLTNIVNKLDVALAQVLIEAIVMEVSLNKSLALGVSAVQQPQSSGSFTGGGMMNNGASVPFRAPGSSAFSTSGGTNAASGLLGGSGLSYLGSFGNNFDVVLSALASDSTVNVVSKPRIQTTHAVPASFFVGDTVPYITGTSYGYGYSGNSYSQYQEKEVGVNLEVTPFITPDGLVVMEIIQEISQLGASVKIDNNDVPTTTKRTANSTVSVEDGKTIMLGGYISNKKTKSRAGVPVLKDIPVLGNLFRSKSDANTRVELMVLMRPTVLHQPGDAARAADIERQRLPGVRATEREFREEEQSWLDKEEAAAKKDLSDKTKKKAKK